jgi:protocatechuate 3,4-dioxygenase beta subunit
MGSSKPMKNNVSFDAVCAPGAAFGVAPAPQAMERRDFLRRVCLGLAAIPAVALLQGCADDAQGSLSSGAGGDADASGQDGAQDSASQADANNPADAVAADAWASGGTAAMTAQATYPDPFPSAAAACLVVAGTTEGPCTTTEDLDREDVSEGWTGLPVRLALKVVDGSCGPLAGAVVKIWHTNITGVYSGKTPSPELCSANDQVNIAANFFRGVQTTDADGVVAFNTCFPGWYRGRAVHIHFQVMSGGRTYKISQVFFPEDVSADIFSNHPEYSGFGQPDTTFSNDNVVAGIGLANMDAHTLAVARMSDGAMLASKVVAVTE